MSLSDGSYFSQVMSGSELHADGHLVWSHSSLMRGELSGSCWPEIIPTHFPKHMGGGLKEGLWPVVPKAKTL